MRARPAPQLPFAWTTLAIQHNGFLYKDCDPKADMERLYSIGSATFQTFSPNTGATWMTILNLKSPYQCTYTDGMRVWCGWMGLCDEHQHLT